LKPKFRAARVYSRERSWDFAIVTEQELRTPYLTNITFLLEFRKHSVDQMLTEVVLEAMAHMSPATPARVLTFLSNDATQKATLLPTLWQLIANGYIGTDLEQRLTMSSPIWLGASKERRKRYEPTARVNAGSNRRMRWQALRYYPHSES
jgi:TnsA endonuclease C terminal